MLADALALQTFTILKNQLNRKRENITELLPFLARSLLKIMTVVQVILQPLMLFLASLFTFSYLMTMLRPVSFNAILQRK